MGRSRLAGWVCGWGVMGQFWREEEGLSEQNIVKCFFWPGEGFALASSAAAAKHFDVWGGARREGEIQS